MRKIAFLGAVVGLAIAHDAAAFCGFYVSGGEAKLFNNATQVVAMRDGTRTVLSLQNNYQGPPQDFAMVIPVPVVLQKENVKTLEKKVFERVDQLASPRLVEYWEQDPCPSPVMDSLESNRPMNKSNVPMPTAVMRQSAAGHVTIEAQFTVGEYEIVILSATDSLALDTWLRQNKYNIPNDAEAYMRPYVQQGMRFFVAKVDSTKVKFENGQVDLSPLRFHFDSEQFFLPIRLGLINASGPQDLIVNVLARGQRYDVANYDNVAVPTNLDVDDSVRNQFPTFYAAVFDDTLSKRPHTVVTEYSWQAMSCDPCPTQPLSMQELAVLGGDVLPSLQPPTIAGDASTPMPNKRPMMWGGGGDFVLTRLHARYTKNVLGDDLFFRAAPPIVGGREFVIGQNGKLEEGAKPAGMNNFQGRYVIRHPWTGAIACKNPRRGMWGGPPGDPYGSKVTPAQKISKAPRSANLNLATLLKGPAQDTFLSAGGLTPTLNLPGAPGVAQPGDAEMEPQGDASLPAPPPVAKGGCGCNAGSPADAAVGTGIIAGLVALLRSRRRRTRQ